MKARNVVGIVLAFVGGAVLLTELAFHWRDPAGYPIGTWPLVIGLAISFVGAYLIDPKQAEDGGGFLVNSAVSIIGVVRGGRRATDPPVVMPPAVALPRATSDAAPTRSVVTEEHDG
jgi:hypothetical protein